MELPLNNNSVAPLNAAETHPYSVQLPLLASPRHKHDRSSAIERCHVSAKCPESFIGSLHVGVVIPLEGVVRTDIRARDCPEDSPAAAQQVILLRLQQAPCVLVLTSMGVCWIYAVPRSSSDTQAAARQQSTAVASHPASSLLCPAWL